MAARLPAARTRWGSDGAAGAGHGKAARTIAAGTIGRQGILRRCRGNFACPVNADGRLVAGTGFRCVAILESLEAALQRPVLSANQASLWRCLRLAGVRDPVQGYGKLLGR